MRLTKREFTKGLVLAIGFAGFTPAGANSSAIVESEARAIAKEAYIYGFPVIDNYRILYSYFVDKAGSEYKAAWNTINNTARVYTPDDTTIQTPNSDTPYSMLGTDLRAEPLVISVPDVEKDRYYSLQFIDLYTFNFAYVGSRATGNNAAAYLLAGPDWEGEKPAGIKDIIRCETQIAFLIYRTQLFDPGDIENVKKIQAGYQVQTLSNFLGKPAPDQPPAIDFPKPLSTKEERSSLEVFRELNFVLQFCPTHPSEKELMARFAKIGIGAGLNFDPASLSPAMNNALSEGIAEAWTALAEEKRLIGEGKIAAENLAGSRDFVNGNYLGRFMVAVTGIYGNSKEEAFYHVHFTDSDGHPTSGAHRYILRMPPGQLPPVNAFWSVTIYKLPESLLSRNPINRYLINSPMLPSLQKDADGGTTLLIQHNSPGNALEANWLPVPEGQFLAVMRLYWPKPEVLSGAWKAPPLQIVS
ncbi:DUF1254 domain-containing protein [Rhizobium leguminosarum]|uniref:DUF1254 domain-containing protein n=1 Tax=Rhizobium leguminosarum TaxID=384 RepID=UPI001D1C31A5|nr:hypothetical protein [Rhizobium leguminosarum]